MGLTIGIAGLPNVGKSTLFNALTKNDVLAANYPFATIQPNVGVVGVPEPRLPVLAKIFGSARIVPSTVSFVDIAGIVKGASEGAGLGNQFLANIREADAICQVIRAFTDPDVVHVDGKISPKDDIEIVNTELILADLQTIEKALPAPGPRGASQQGARSGARRGRACPGACWNPARPSSPLSLDPAPLRELQLMTAKPFLYVFNMDPDELVDAAFTAELRELVAPAEAIFLDAKTEAELVELPRRRRDGAAAIDGSAGVRPGSVGPRRFRDVGAAVVPDRWAERGARLDHPARRHGAAGRGVIHTDFERGFIKAEIVSLRRPRRRRIAGRGAGPRSGPNRGQGLRHGRRGRGGVQVQCLVRCREGPNFLR